MCMCVCLFVVVGCKPLHVCQRVKLEYLPQRLNHCQHFRHCTRTKVLQEATAGTPVGPSVDASQFPFVISFKVNLMNLVFWGRGTLCPTDRVGGCCVPMAVTDPLHRSDTRPKTHCCGPSCFAGFRLPHPLGQLFCEPRSPQLLFKNRSYAGLAPLPWATVADDRGYDGT